MGSFISRLFSRKKGKVDNGSWALVGGNRNNEMPPPPEEEEVRNNHYLEPYVEIEPDDIRQNITLSGSFFYSDDE